MNVGSRAGRFFSRQWKNRFSMVKTRLVKIAFGGKNRFLQELSSKCALTEF